MRKRSIDKSRYFCAAGRAIGHERDQEGKYPLEGGCERGGEGHDGVEPKGGIMDSHQHQFCLKWNSFGSNLATAFSNLFKNESLTDVTLFCEGEFLAEKYSLLPAAGFVCAIPLGSLNKLLVAK